MTAKRDRPLPLRKRPRFPAGLFCPLLFLPSPILLALSSSACSGFNREGPDTTCEALDGGRVNACQDGIIASCEDGLTVTYEVCTEPQGHTSPRDICGAPWQTDGAYRCIAGPANIQIDSVRLSHDSNDDGLLSPGEGAWVTVYAKNTGGKTAERVLVSVTDWDENIRITECAQASTGGSTACFSDGKCDCEVFRSETLAGAYAAQTLRPGKTGTEYMPNMVVQLDSSAPLRPIQFSLEYRDDAGSTWTDSFQLNVEGPGANLQIEHTELTDDSNGDGLLSPGERATVVVYARNAGTSAALEVTTALTSYGPGVALEGCNAGLPSSDFIFDCGSSCNCSDVTDYAKPDMPAESTIRWGILTITFSLAVDAPLEPISFLLAFHDGSGNTWTDTFQLEVVP